MKTPNQYLMQAIGIKNESSLESFPLVDIGQATNAIELAINDKIDISLTEETKLIIEYIHEYKWEYNKLNETELSHEEKVKRIGQKIRLPQEFFDTLTKDK